MNKTAGNFMKAGVIYALLGFVLGLVIGASKSFELKSVHSHLNLVGWATMGIFALYYQLVPAAARSAAARVHFWLANAGLVLMSASLAMLVYGFGSAEPGVVIGSFLTLFSIMLFVIIVFRTAGAQCLES